MLHGTAKKKKKKEINIFGIEAHFKYMHVDFRDHKML